VNRLGPYQLLRKLGVGGTAEVYLATGPNPKGVELLALKVVLPHLAEDEQLRAMMLKEARTSALLHHPNVVEIIEVGDTEGRPFLAMEFIPGWSVAALEKRVQANSELLPIGEACAIVREAALGLHYAHEAKSMQGHALGLVHRDVSPQNIMVSQDGIVKVVDFGIAKATEEQATQTGGIKGKLPYMPPEQLRGKQLDRRVDVFALGAVLWELCCGQLMYPGRNEAEIIRQALNEAQPDPKSLVPDLPDALAAVLLRAVARDAAARTPTALALAEALGHWVPKDFTARLAARVQKNFKPLPTTASGAVGLPSTPEAEPRARRKSSAEGRSVTPRPSTARVKTALNFKMPSNPLEMPRVQREAPQVQRLFEESVSEEIELPKEKGSKWGYVLFLLALCGVGWVVYATVRGVAPWSPKGRNVITLEDGSDPDAPIDADGKPRSAVPKGPKGKLATTKGTLIIHCDVPAIVREYGKDLGVTPLTLTVPAGPHRLQLTTTDRHEETLVEVNVPAGEQVFRSVTLRGH
jgi:serine/threonine protein kinase